MRAKPIVVSVKGLVFDDQRRVLLLKRSISSHNNPCKWDLPGGKMDCGESVDQALVREIREETGLTVSVGKLAASTESDSPDRRIAYLILECRVESGELKLSEEHEQHCWAGLEELCSLDIVPQFCGIVRQLYGTGC